MQKFYVQYDSFGAVIGRLSSDGDVPSGNYLEVTDATTMAQTINDGWAVVNGSLVPPTSEQLITTAQAIQIAAIEADYQVAIQHPVEYMDTTFQADKDSQDVLTKCLVAGSVPTGFYWLDANNVQVIMTFAQLQGLAGAMLVQGQTAFAHLQAKKSAIKAVTTTVVDVQSIVW
jgi:hypothetical protein